MKQKQSTVAVGFGDGHKTSTSFPRRLQEITKMKSESIFSTIRSLQIPGRNSALIASENIALMRPI